jgi:hypothetical protein
MFVPVTAEMRKKTWRNYWEAVRFAQTVAEKHNITTGPMWKEKYKELNLPPDIPRHPEIVYDGFSWKVWLNKTVQAKIETARSDVSIICFHHVKDEPSNVIKMKVWKDGYVSMMNEVKDSELDEPNPKCVWKNEEGAIDYTIKTLKQHGSQVGDTYIITNMSALIWDMMELEIYQSHT